jgi:hypothetical protein
MNQEGAEHAHPRDEGNKREVSKPGMNQEGAEQTLPRDEGNKGDVSEYDRTREQSTHFLGTRRVNINEPADEF